MAQVGNRGKRRRRRRRRCLGWLAPVAGTDVPVARRREGAAGRRPFPAGGGAQADGRQDPENRAAAGHLGHGPGTETQEGELAQPHLAAVTGQQHQ